MGVVVAVLLALAVVLLLAGAAWAYQTANRLDRLHVRYDLSWSALDGLLARRAVVARAVAAAAGLATGPSPDAGGLAELADAAERAPRGAREAAENELSAALSAVDPAALPVALVAEIADAEARVMLARRFHNDAVRDTLALRERSLVRWLRLGGTAAMPNYFEIAERSGRPAAGRPTRRVSARVVLLDEQGCVLLLHGCDPARPGPGHDHPEQTRTPGPPTWWFTVGGAVEAGESLASAAARELAEETGLRAAPDQLIGPIWRREATFEFNGAPIRSEEMFFVHRTRRFDPVTTGHTALERLTISGHRWCDEAAIAELVAGGEPVYPLQLAELLGAANATADAGSAAPPVGPGSPPVGPGAPPGGAAVLAIH